MEQDFVRDILILVLGILTGHSFGWFVFLLWYKHKIANPRFKHAEQHLEELRQITRSRRREWGQDGD